MIQYEHIWQEAYIHLYGPSLVLKSCECMFTMLLLSSLGQWLALHFNKRKKNWNPLHLQIVCAKFARVFGPVVLEKNLVWAKKKNWWLFIINTANQENILIFLYISKHVDFLAFAKQGISLTWGKPLPCGDVIPGPCQASNLPQPSDFWS